VAAVFVAVYPPNPQVLGYYTLSAAAVDLAKIPAKMAKGLPRYPRVPVTLLGRLAVDRGRQGMGLGELLLVDALQRSLAQTTEIGSVAVVVDALNREVAGFYTKYGFSRLTDNGDRLIMPMARIATAFGAGS
jgi:predicted GNAT family N-acyltransferase